MVGNTPPRVCDPFVVFGLPHPQPALQYVPLMRAFAPLVGETF